MSINSSMDLTSEDLSLIEDSDFLLVKVQVLQKINSLMEETQSALQQKIGASDFVFPLDMNLSDGKISKGEYYLNLPYFVLDYPALFSKRDMFAFRTMFWWGNFFSATLHLQGTYLDEHRQHIADNIENLLNKDVYISVGDSPWDYHYKPDNYVLLQADHSAHVSSCEFLKFSKKINLTDWASVPSFSAETFELLVSVL